MKKQIIAALTVLEFSVSSLVVIGYAREISEFSNFKVTYSGGGSVTIQGLGVQIANDGIRWLTKSWIHVIVYPTFINIFRR